ncbi:MAG: Na+/H+ antiporter NhaC [Calditrichaeota bacterium]|nr:MAG: Na+/H+ antiporter NhaC [Calditrichota bacterium]
MISNRIKEVTFFRAFLPILFLLSLLVYGLILRPHVFDQPAFPLEIVFIFAAALAIAELFWLGFSWNAIQQSIIKKLAKAIPAFFILFTIGLIISSWMICGTIPMLVYYGIKIINPAFLYVLAFLVPVVFSSLTGTSWGSVGTIGVVIIGIAGAVGAHLGITAGAIIGGAYFGDKMSPLSDTTNVAALATDVDLFDHIQSMMVTTLPSAIVAALLFFLLGFIYQPAGSAINPSSTPLFLQSIESIFSFNPLLLLPPAIVLYGSIKKKPPIPTLITSVLAAAFLTLIIQKFTMGNVVQSLYKGFNTEMVIWAGPIPETVSVLTNRGGLYELNEAITISFMIFVYIGAIDHINAMPIVVHRLFFFAKSRASTILSTLVATAITNSMTSNQYATSFVVGDAFKSKYDELKIPRKVLSRSLEDTGTMLESVVPWTTTSVFMVATLGVPYQEYWHWQLLSLINFIVAPSLAILGIGCFYHEIDKIEEDDC